MRYPSEIPEAQLTLHAHDDMLLFTAAMAVFVGIALVWLGKKGRFMWMWTWGAGLVVVSIGMGFTILFD